MTYRTQIIITKIVLKYAEYNEQNRLTCRLKTHQTAARVFNLLKPTGYAIHQQFNIQQLYVLPTLYLCVLCLSENKQRLVALTA